VGALNFGRRYFRPLKWAAVSEGLGARARARDPPYPLGSRGLPLRGLRALTSDASG
jgi:hypothetical protein